MNNLEIKNINIGQIHGYERNGGVDNITHNLHTFPRQFYRYLDIAYMNPDKINETLSGKLKINVNELFQIAKTNVLHKAPTCYN